jgi:hypothetical protein
MLTLKIVRRLSNARLEKVKHLSLLRFYQKLDQLYTIQLDQLWAVRFLNNNVNQHRLDFEGCILPKIILSKT